MLAFGRVAVACCLFAGLAMPVEAAVRALLIGVSDYRESSVPDLTGPLNDIALIKGVLTTRFSVPASSIRILENPTHTEIERAFADLASAVRPEDQVYVHFSGHGSWSPAPPPQAGEAAERNGQDQTWVPYGSRSSRRQGKDALDVLDKEIALWLDPIYKVTPDVVFVSDSCHSATVTRGEQRGVRSIDGAPAPHPLRATIRRVLRPTVGLRIGAARDSESAVEFDPRASARCIDKANCYGAFTWHWAAALTSSRPDESWGEVFQRADAALVATPGVLQRPQMEGVADRALFRGQFAPPSALVPVTSVGSGGVLTLGAGLLSGVTVGSTFATAGPQAAAAKVQVTSVTAGSAEASLLGGSIKAGDVVREVEHRAKPLRLFVGSAASTTADAALVEQVRKAVENARPYALQGVELVTDRERADWRMEVVRQQQASGPGVRVLPARSCQAEPCAEPELWVVSPIGQLMHARMRSSLADPARAVPIAVSNLAAYMHAREVRSIGAQGNLTPLQVTVRVLRPPVGNVEKCAEGARDGSGWERFQPVPLESLGRAEVRLGDCLAFTLANRSPDRSWYGYLLSVDPTFAVQPIWPLSGSNEEEARIEPKGTLVVRDSYYRLSDLGRETLLFVSSAIPAPLMNFARGGMRGKGEPATDSLNRLLHASALTRGTETAIGEWGAQSLDIEVPAPAQ